MKEIGREFHYKEQSNGKFSSSGTGCRISCPRKKEKHLLLAWIRLSKQTPGTMLREQCKVSKLFFSGIRQKEKEKKGRSKMAL